MFWSAPPESFETLSRAEALARHPGFYDLLDHWDEDRDDETVIVLRGDHHLTEAWWDALDACDSRHILIEGDLRLDFQSWFTFWATGDIHGTGLSLEDERLLALGAIHSADYAGLYADDDGLNRTPPRLVLRTPYLFCWFYQIEPLTLSPDTVVFILGDWDYCESLRLDNPTFAWHEGIHALRDELQYPLESWGDDHYCWNKSEVERRLSRGEPILRDGVDPAALPHCREGDGAMRMGDQRLAWLHYREAARQAPGYYPPAMTLGRLLYRQGAYAQALPWLRRALGLFPAAQQKLYDEAAFFAAMAALRLDRPGEALAIVSAALERTGEQAAELYRVSAEAHLVLGEADHADAAHHRSSAERDLRNGLELADTDHPVLNWLMGLLLYRAGRLDEAESWRQKAMAGGEVFDCAFADHSTTAFLSKPACEVDWETLTLADFEPEHDAVWWRERVLSDPAQLRRMPEDWRDAELFDALLARYPEDALNFAAGFPDSAYTPAVARRLVGESATCLRYVPTALIDKSLCLAVTPERGAMSIEQVPEDVLDGEVCRHLLHCGVRLDDLPAERLDRELCEAAVRIDGGNIEQVPVEIADDALWLLALAHGTYWFVENRIPARFKTPAMLKRALDLDRAALDSIPGRLFDEELYRHAQARYGQDADWAGIVDRHGPDGETTEFARQCWLVFWSDELLLNRIGLPRGRLSASEIPPGRFDQAIADACFAADPRELTWIPPRFVSADMAERFIESEHGRLRDLPWSRRSVEVCMAALHGDTEQADQVPAESHAEVFDRLIALGYPKRFDYNWLRLERGRGWLMLEPPRIAAARADFEAVLDGTAAPVVEKSEAEVDEPFDSDSEPDDEGDDILALLFGSPSDFDSTPEWDAERWSPDARFLLGYCAWLEGDRERAAALLRASGLMEDEDHYARYDPRVGREG